MRSNFEGISLREEGAMQAGYPMKGKKFIKNYKQIVFKQFIIINALIKNSVAV